MSNQEKTPNLVAYLTTKYAENLSGTGEAEASVRAKLSELKPFLKFLNGFLSDNRPRGIAYMDDNFRLKLSNGDEFLISPDVESLRGTMVSTTGVPVDATPGVNPHYASMQQGAVPITGANLSKPAVDYSASDGKGVLDQTADKGVKNFAARHYVEDLLNS